MLSKNILNFPEVRNAGEMDDSGVDLFSRCLEAINLVGGFDPTRH